MNRLSEQIFFELAESENDDSLEVWPSYGPEMRGGTANCNVILSDDPVGSPIVTNPDILIAMNLPSLQKFIGTVVPGGQVYVDSSLIEEKVERTDVTVFYIPVTPEDYDEGGLRGALSGAINASFVDMIIATGKLNDVVFIEQIVE